MVVSLATCSCFSDFTLSYDIIVGASLHKNCEGHKRVCVLMQPVLSVSVLGSLGLTHLSLSVVTGMPLR